MTESAKEAVKQNTTKENKMNVNVERINAFPIEFFGFTFPEEMITPLYNEVMEKEDEIKRISDMHADGVILESSDYWTDYSQPVKLHEWNKLIPYVRNYFSKNFNCSCMEHWVSIYGRHGVHGLHNHSEFLYVPKVVNFSCVLYLTNIGSTTFFNPNTHNVTEQILGIKSRLGQLIMFPSNIIHTSHPHNLDKEKIIISANWQILKKGLELPPHLLQKRDNSADASTSTGGRKPVNG